MSPSSLPGGREKVGHEEEEEEEEGIAERRSWLVGAGEEEDMEGGVGG